MIAFDGAGLAYPDGTQALECISLDVRTGELLALLGPSGSGKTTALKLVNRLLEPTRGRVLIDDRDVASEDPIALRRRVGYVFQRFGLFPHLTLAENVGIVPDLLRWTDERIRERTDELLGLLGLPPDEYRHRYPASLSGGQQQRVGVARAIAARPDILLLDEPFGALDPITRDRLQIEVKRIHRELGLTSLLVTHDVTEALLLADRIAVLEAGRVVQIGKPRDLLEAPESELVRELMQTPRRQLDRLGRLAGAPAAGDSTHGGPATP